MATGYKKFATQADPKVLAAIRAIAASEGKELRAVINEALRDFIDKKKHGTPRSKVLIAFGESLAEYDALHKELAK